METFDSVTPPALAARDVGKTFLTSSGQVIEALTGVDMDIPDNSFVCLVGPSGCGKSTLLRMMAGLDRCTQGALYYRGREQRSPRPEIGMIFQEYSLFPWLPVLDNVAMGLEFSGMGREARREKGMNYLELVGLAKYGNAMPHELSGGMRQRVAIARALANEPDILLMDEPFGAIDAYTRIRLQKKLLDIWQKHKKTVLFVTHSVDEAIFLADHIIVMGTNPGRILTRLEVPLERPRQRNHPEYARLLVTILELLEQTEEDE